jgi:hypothetical protein
MIISVISAIMSMGAHVGSKLTVTNSLYFTLNP